MKQLKDRDMDEIIAKIYRSQTLYTHPRQTVL